MVFNDWIIKIDDKFKINKLMELNWICSGHQSRIPWNEDFMRKFSIERELIDIIVVSNWSMVLMIFAFILKIRIILFYCASNDYVILNSIIMMFQKGRDISMTKPKTLWKIRFVILLREMSITTYQLFKKQRKLCLNDARIFSSSFN